MRIELVRIRFERVNTHSPDPDPILINPNPLPEVVLIWIDLDCAIVLCMWAPKGAWHACSYWLSTVNALLQATHVFHVHVSAQLKKQYYGWLKYRSDEGAMCGGVATWSQHAHVNSFHTMQCRHNQCTLDSHWLRIGKFGYWIGIQCEQALIHTFV